MTNRDQPTTEPDDRPAERASRYAQQAEQAIRDLVHLILTGPDLTPAEVEVVLGHLAETLAALPQVATQLGGILDQARDTHHLAMDRTTATTDPDLAIDTARHHLDELRGPAVQTYRHLDAARNEAAHISSVLLDGTPDALDVVPRPFVDGRYARPEHREPPPVPRPGSNGPTR